MSVRKPRLQTCRRSYDGRCFFCGEPNPDLLDCHRIVPGEQGGRYEWANTLTVCSNCHRRIHSGDIVVFARRYGTGGSYIHCRVGGEEKLIRETR